MRPAPIVVGGVILQNAPQLRFVEHDQVIEAFAPDRSDEALDVAVLPRRARRSRMIANPPLYECGWYRLGRMRRREAGNVALRPRGKHQLPDLRSTGLSDW